MNRGDNADGRSRTTAITIRPDHWERIRAMASGRALANGSRVSASAIIMEIFDQHFAQKDRGN